MDQKDVSKRKTMTWEKFGKAHEQAHKEVKAKGDLIHPGGHKIEAEGAYTRHDSNVYKAHDIKVDPKQDNINDYVKPGLTQPVTKDTKEITGATASHAIQGALNQGEGISESEGRITEWENFEVSEEEEEDEDPEDVIDDVYEMQSIMEMMAETCSSMEDEAKRYDSDEDETHTKAGYVKEAWSKMQEMYDNTCKDLGIEDK